MHTLSSVYEATPPHLGTITCSQILPKMQLLFGFHTSVAPWRILILRHWTKMMTEGSAAACTGVIRVHTHSQRQLQGTE